MKLGIVSFLAALVAAPLAAQPAESPARFSVTLRATVTDTFTYELSQGECVIHKSGASGRELRLRSTRPARVRVGDTTVYRPSRVAVRATGTAMIGSFTQIRSCLGEVVRTTGDCKARSLTSWRMRAGFYRPGRDALAFRASPSGVQVCGLDEAQPGGWLDLAPGRIDEDALLNGRSLRIVARGSATRETAIESTRSVRITRRSTVRWTLTFRRLR